MARNNSNDSTTTTTTQVIIAVAWLNNTPEWNGKHCPWYDQFLGKTLAEAQEIIDGYNTVGLRWMPRAKCWQNSYGGRFELVMGDPPTPTTPAETFCGCGYNERWPTGTACPRCGGCLIPCPEGVDLKAWVFAVNKAQETYGTTYEGDPKITQFLPGADLSGIAGQGQRLQDFIFEGKQTAERAFEIARRTLGEARVDAKGVDAYDSTMLCQDRWGFRAIASDQETTRIVLLVEGGFHTANPNTANGELAEEAAEYLSSLNDRFKIEPVSGAWSVRRWLQGSWHPSMMSDDELALLAQNEGWNPDETQNPPQSQPEQPESPIIPQEPTIPNRYQIEIGGQDDYQAANYIIRDPMGTQRWSTSFDHYKTRAEALEGALKMIPEGASYQVNGGPIVFGQNTYQEPDRTFKVWVCPDAGYGLTRTSLAVTMVDKDGKDVTTYLKPEESVQWFENRLAELLADKTVLDEPVKVSVEDRDKAVRSHPLYETLLSAEMAYQNSQPGEEAERMVAGSLADFIRDAVGALTSDVQRCLHEDLYQDNADPSEAHSRDAQLDEVIVEGGKTQRMRFEEDGLDPAFAVVRMLQNRIEDPKAFELATGLAVSPESLVHELFESSYGYQTDAELDTWLFAFASHVPADGEELAGQIWPFEGYDASLADNEQEHNAWLANQIRLDAYRQGYGDPAAYQKDVEWFLANQDQWPGAYAVGSETEIAVGMARAERRARTEEWTLTSTTDGELWNAYLWSSEDDGRKMLESLGGFDYDPEGNNDLQRIMRAELARTFLIENEGPEWEDGI